MIKIGTLYKLKKKIAKEDGYLTSETYTPILVQGNPELFCMVCLDDGYRWSDACNYKELKAMIKHTFKRCKKRKLKIVKV
jgi:hypothetical protein